MPTENEYLEIINIECGCGCVYSATVEHKPWAQQVFTVCPQCGAVQTAYELDDYKMEV